MARACGAAAKRGNADDEATAFASDAAAGVEDASIFGDLGDDGDDGLSLAADTGDVEDAKSSAIVARASIVV